MDNIMRAARRAYVQQRNGARHRGIDWEFTFDAWWEIWQPYWHLRGPGKNGLCMAREKDEGPYAPGNVYLTTNLGNLMDYSRFSPAAAEARKARKEAAEMRFAREGKTRRAGRLEQMSHIAYKAQHTSQALCNIKEDEVE